MPHKLTKRCVLIAYINEIAMQTPVTTLAADVFKGEVSPCSTVDVSRSASVRSLTSLVSEGLSLMPAEVHMTELDQYVDRFFSNELLERYPYLRDQTAEAQAKRIDLVRNKIIVFVCTGNYDDKKQFYVHLLQNYGIRSVIIEAADNGLVRWLLDNQVVEGYLEVDMTPRPTIAAECISAVAQWCKRTSNKISGVCTLWDDAVGLASRVATAFGVDNLTTMAVDIAHDKSGTRRFLEASGLPCPRNFTIRSKADLPAAAARVGFPAVLKPAIGNASVGVMKVMSADELDGKFDELQEILDITYQDGDFMGFTFEDAEADVSKHSAELRNVLLETFMDGPEVDVDFVMSEGRIAYCNIVDDWEYEEPYYIELGNNCPTRLGQEQEQQLKDAASEIVEALGCFSGVLHVEMKLTTNGPRLIEVNPRLGGGAIHYFHREIYGVDLLLEQCLVAVGIPCNPPQKYSGKIGVSVHFFAPETGTIVKADHVEYDNPAVGFCFLGVKPGDKVTAWKDGFPPHVGRVDLCAASFDEALRLCREVENRLVFDIVPEAS